MWWQRENSFWQWNFIVYWAFWRKKEINRTLYPAKQEEMNLFSDILRCPESYAHTLRYIYFRLASRTNVYNVKHNTGTSRILAFVYVVLYVFAEVSGIHFIALLFSCTNIYPFCTLCTYIHLYLFWSNSFLMRETLSNRAKEISGIKDNEKHISFIKWSINWGCRV